MTKSDIGSGSSYPLSRAQGLQLVLDTPKGRGVFASESIRKGTVIETSPVLILTKKEVENHTSQTCLDHYTYYWPDPEGGAETQAIALGLGSMFNHSRLRQNVTWSRNPASGVIVYVAHRDIEPGEELCISYGSARLWFKDADDSSDAETAAKDEMTRSGLDAIMALDSESDA